MILYYVYVVKFIGTNEFFLLIGRSMHQKEICWKSEVSVSIEVFIMLLTNTGCNGQNTVIYQKTVYIRGGIQIPSFYKKKQKSSVRTILYSNIKMVGGAKIDTPNT